MDKFAFISPLDYRYLPQDDELSNKVRAYSSLDVFSQLKAITREVFIPRLHSLETELLRIAEEHREKQVPRRVDGRHAGTTTLGEIYIDYARRLRKRLQQINGVPLIFESLGEAERNETISDLVYFSV